jgi:pimeloyl-ACP methyl ester carboxylesterase
LMFPKNFDPARSWPILIVRSTTDLDRTSIMDAPWYRESAMAEGWVVLATDATIRSREDSLAWRLSMLTAGLEVVRDNWPQSAHWPVGFAGFSGGAKSSGILGAMLAKENKIKICGFFLAGINSDRLSAAYQDYHPPTDFLNVPVWISSGMQDQIAPPGAQEGVYYSLKRTGFKQVRLEKFFGGHALRSGEIQRALHWFREIGKF